METTRNNRRTSRRNRLMLQTILVVGAAFAFFFSMQVLSAPEFQPNILISEVLAQNNDVIADEDGGYPDFIELYNAGKGAVNLRGWYLSDSDVKTLKWRLPQIIIQPGEYLIFFASGKDKQQEDGIWHTNFKISSDGTEPVVLTMPDGKMHSRCPPFDSAPNISYALVDDFSFYAYMSYPTPGAANTNPFFHTLAELSPISSKLIISEYMTKNDSFFPDDEGLFHDWVEIYNPGEETVYLGGWCLSDNKANLLKWRFPVGMSIPPGGYIAVHCSGLDKPGHASFSLSERDEFLTLSDPSGYKIDEIAVHNTTVYASYGRSLDGREGFYANPSPGEENIGIPAATLAELEWERPPIKIMEYMSSNSFYYPDEDGDFNDWVEILNHGDDTFNLSGYYLSDSIDNLGKWKFPGGTLLEPGARIVVQLSGKPLPGHASFSLSVNDDGIFLSDTNGRVVDSVSIEGLPSHVSHGRDENNYDRWLFFPRPTPGAPNNTNGFESFTGITAAGWGGLYISQVSQNNWVDITNATDNSISTIGWRLLSSSESNRFEPLANNTLDAGETKRFNLRDITISQRGQTLTLTDGEDYVSDIFVTGTLRNGVTVGRTGTASAHRVLFDANGVVYSGYAMSVTADVDDIVVAAGTQVTLTTLDPTGAIYYTLDGTIPTMSSTRYTSPIVISKNTVLRAAIVSPGLLPGLILSRTYLVNSPHDLPIVALTTAPANMFSHSTGIYADGPGWTSTFPHVGANYWKADWERDVHFALYENGALSVEADAGIKIHGQYSRAEPQKSLAIFFRKKYGVSRLAYPLIPGIDRTVFDAIILRTSGQDWKYSKLRDSFVHTSVLDVTNVVAMGARPVVVYINGEYWGLYYIREKINEDYFAINEGIPNDQIDIIKHNRMELAGSNSAYLAMVDKLRNMRMNTDEGYAYADANIDLDNWIDYWIVVTYFGNTDTGNIKFYRQRGEGHKWRWILFDQDWALWQSTYDWNLLDHMIDPTGHGVGKNFSTVVARALLSNDRIKARFIERYAELLHTVLSTDRLLGILDGMVAQIESEMPRQIERWGGPASMSTWNNHLGRIRNIVTEKEKLMKRHLRSTFNISSARMDELFPEGW